MGAAALTGCGGGSGSTSQNNDASAEAEAGAEDASAADEAAAEAGAEDAAAGDAAEAGSEDLLAKIQSAGKIVIAMEGNWAPWTYEDENGNLVGFEVEVSGAVAEKLGVTPEYVTGEWDGLLAGVQAGRYDLMANGVGYTEERAQAYTFSDFYAFNRTALVVRGDNEEIKSMEDLAGKTTCNSANSTYQLLAEKYGATVKDVESLAGTIDELMAGRVDATLNAEVSINDYMREQPDADIKIVAFDEDVEQVGMIMPYGESSASLCAAINQALAELREEGKLAEISTKYFGMDITTNE
jgi:cystine transport system substrate-binding protein